MASVKISPKKCKIAMALAGHHTAALRQRPWVRIPLKYQKFFRVDLQLLKLQLRLRRSHLSGGVGGGGEGPGLQKFFFSALRASVWSRSATASSFKSFTCVSLRNYLVTFLPPRTTSHVPPYEWVTKTFHYQLTTMSQTGQRKNATNHETPTTKCG